MWSNILHIKHSHNTEICTNNTLLLFCSVPSETFVFQQYEMPHLKGCGMGPWLVLVSPCFRENLVATCKIGSFLCSLDNLLQKNVIVLFFGNQISKWHSFEKRAIFDLHFTFLVTRKKLQKFLQHMSHSHT